MRQLLVTLCSSIWKSVAKFKILKKKIPILSRSHEKKENFRKKITNFVK